MKADEGKGGNSETSVHVRALTLNGNRETKRTRCEQSLHRSPVLAQSGALSKRHDLLGSRVGRLRPVNEEQVNVLDVELGQRLFESFRDASVVGAAAKGLKGRGSAVRQS